MRKTLNLMFIAVLALSLFACGEKKLTYEDMRKAEATLFNENGTFDTLKAPKVAEKYCQFVEQNPDDSTAPIWLYHAIEINVLVKNWEKSIALCDQLTEQYPESPFTPFGMYLTGSFVYEDEYKDLDKAREIYERIINDYPDSKIVKSVESSLKYLGWTPEEIMADYAWSTVEDIDFSDSIINNGNK